MLMLTRAITFAFILPNTYALVVVPTWSDRAAIGMFLAMFIWNQVSFEAKWRKQIAEAKEREGGSDAH